MKTIMIFLSALITVFTSTAALAHTDHGLGEGMLHATFHIVFWFVLCNDRLTCLTHTHWISADNYYNN